MHPIFNLLQTDCKHDVLLPRTSVHKNIQSFTNFVKRGIAQSIPLTGKKNFSLQTVRNQHKFIAWSPIVNVV